MPLRLVFFIAFRFYAIYFATQVLPLIPVIVFFAGQWMVMGRSDVAAMPEQPWPFLFCPLIWVLVAAALWVGAGRLSAAMTRGLDPQVRFDITRQDIFAVAFVFLGLYFVLDSVGPTLVDVVRLINAVQNLPFGDPGRVRATTDLYKSGITLIAGLASVLGSGVWSRKLSRRAGLSPS